MASNDTVLIPGVPLPDGSRFIPGMGLVTADEFAALPHDSAGTRLVVSIWLLILLASIFLGMRLYCKLSRHSGLWWDDHILIGSWICITVESCLLSYAVSLGYGIHLWDINFADIETGRKMGLAINIGGTFSIVAAIWSKTSFAITLLKLTHGWLKATIWFIIISMNIAMGISALNGWIHCTPVQKNYDFSILEGSCWPPNVLVDYHIFSASYSAAMDITLALIPWKLIMGLQMKRREKIGAGIAMSMGIFAGITAIIKTSKLRAMESIDPADGIDLFIWGNAESCVTIVAASIPVLRVLVRDVATSAARRYYGSSGSQPGNSKALRSGNRHLGGGGTGTGTGIGGGGTKVSVMSTTRSRLDNMTRGAKDDDDSSDRSILDSQQGLPRHHHNSGSVGFAVSEDNAGSLPIHHPGQIMRTDEVAVEYHDRRRDGDVPLQTMRPA